MSGIGMGVGLAKLGSRLGLQLLPTWAKRLLAIVAVLLAIAAAAWAATAWHDGKIAAHDRALTAKVTADVNKQWQGRFDAMRTKADQVRRQAEAIQAGISAIHRGRHDEQTRRDAAAAADLRLRGPGAAAAPAGCRPVDHSGLSAGAGRPDPASGTGANAAGDVPAANGAADVPAGGFAVVPWGWVVDVAQGADGSRNEALTWRAWYADQFKAWEQMRRKAIEPAKGKKGQTDGRR